MVTFIEHKEGLQSVPASEALESLVDDITELKHRGTSRIFTGEAHPAIYGRRFYDAAQQAIKDRRAKMFFITSPIVLVDNDEFNAVLSLAEDYPFNTRLYHRLGRGKTRHFRIVSTKYGYNYSVESAHPPLLSPEQRHTLHVQAGPRDREYPTIIAHRLVFDNWVRQITERDPSLGKCLPLLTTEDALGELVDLAAKANRPFDDLGPEGLLGLPGGRDRLKPAPIIYI